MSFVRKLQHQPGADSTTFNIFMNAIVGDDGNISAEMPSSQAGDYTDFHAKIDMVFVLTSCSYQKSNNGTFKPINYEIVMALNQFRVEI